MKPLPNAAGLRIAHLIECDGPGGAERVVAQLAASLQEAGSRNVVFLPADGEGWIASELRASGVTVEHFRIEQPLSRTCARFLEEAFRRHRIALAHSHEFTMAVYGAWACWRVGIPHVITMHGGRYYAGRIRRRLALRMAVGLSGRTVAVSSSVARELRRDLCIRRSRVAHIPNGVRYVPPDRTTLREELGLGPADRLLVSVGSLYPVKGHEYAIDALALLANRYPTLHFAIAGRGELLDSLSARARARGVMDRVHLVGLRSDVAGFLAAADIFVLPSLSEALPLALLEAMFAGRPIVATAVGDVGAALGYGEAGVLVEAGNAVALAAGLDRVLANPEQARELGERARLRARARYDVSRMVRDYADVYGELIAGASAARVAAALAAEGG
jgi:glycosyltransferase involved in cell wall biosynthesis